MILQSASISTMTLGTWTTELSSHGTCKGHPKLVVSHICTIIFSSRPFETAVCEIEFSKGTPSDIMLIVPSHCTLAGLFCGLCYNHPSSQQVAISLVFVRSKHAEHQWHGMHWVHHQCSLHRRACCLLRAYQHKIPPGCLLLTLLFQ